MVIGVLLFALEPVVQSELAGYAADKGADAQWEAAKPRRDALHSVMWGGGILLVAVGVAFILAGAAAARKKD